MVQQVCFVFLVLKKNYTCDLETSFHYHGTQEHNGVSRLFSFKNAFKKLLIKAGVCRTGQMQKIMMISLED